MQKWPYATKHQIPGAFEGFALLSSPPGLCPGLAGGLTAVSLNLVFSIIVILIKEVKKAVSTGI